MKTWTIVIEVKDNGDNDYNCNEIEKFIVNDTIPADITYRIMEVIDAPYGPAKPFAPTRRKNIALEIAEGLNNQTRKQ